MLYGVNGVPLVYVIREDEEPEEGRPTPTSLKNVLRNANSLDRNSMRILNTSTTLYNR
jgi:hypothetical protein